MYSFDLPQWLVGGYISLVLIGTPVIRVIMINNGATGFVPWREFWGRWSIDAVLKAALVGVLYWGGFWS